MRRILHFACITVVAVAAFAVAMPAAHASPTTYTFIGAGDGHSWGQSANWSPSGTPIEGDSVVIQQQGNTIFHVDNVQTTVLGTLTLGPGCSMAGDPVQAANVSWSGGAIYNEVTAVTGLEVTGPDRKTLQKLNNDPQSGRLIISDQASITGDGELRLIMGEIVNDGTIHSLGAPGSAATINGNFGANAKGVFTNNGTITASQNTTLHLENFALDDLGALGGGEPGLSGGTVRISGSDVHLPTNATVEDHIVIDDASVVTSDGNISLHPGATLTEGGSTSTTLQGTATFIGTGTFEWLTGIIKAQATVSAGVTMRIDSAALHLLDNKFAGPLVVSPGGVVEQRDTGPVRLGIGTYIVNQGQWKVNDVGAVVGGVECCVPTALATFINQGDIDIDQNGTLTLGAGPSVVGLDYRQLGSGRVRPLGSTGGRLILNAGDSELRGGVFDHVDVDLVGNGTVHVANSVNITAGTVVRQTESTDVDGQGTFGGGGTYRWSDGTLTGRFVFGPSLSLVVDDPVAPGGVKILGFGDTGGRIDIRGKGVFKSSQPIRVTSGSSKVSNIVNRGTLTWSRGTIDYAGVVGTFANHGTLRVRGGTGATLTERLAMSNDGDITLRSGTLAAAGGSFVQTGGTIKLDGHVLSSDAGVRLDGGTLFGPGKIVGGVNNHAGRVAFDTRGRLTVTGNYTQGSNGTLRAFVGGDRAVERDAVDASGALRLAGDLVLKRLGSSSIAAYAFVAGASRSGKFGSVSGLSDFPSAYDVTYTATAARLSR